MRAKTAGAPSSPAAIRHECGCTARPLHIRSSDDGDDESKDPPMRLLRVRYIAPLVAGILSISGPAQAIVCIVGGVAGAAIQAAEPNYCQASTSSGPARCTFVAVGVGDIVGQGTWSVYVQRGTQRLAFHGDNGTEAATTTGAILAGDRVEVNAGPGFGVVSAGCDLMTGACPLG